MPKFIVKMLKVDDVVKALNRIKPLVHNTPIVESSLLNEWLGHRVLFKAECMQKIGAFKIRGAMNALAKCHEKGQLPTRVVANSSGNHAQAVACAAKHFGIPATIYAAKNISPIKAAATRYYGAELKLFDTRLEADAAVQEAAANDVLWLPPFNHPDIMAGQGTAFQESIPDLPKLDAVAVPCGGGGLLSGTYVSAKAHDSDIKVLAAEPLASNDAAQSRRTGKIVRFTTPQTTLADGAATPSVGHLTFPFVQQADGFYEVSELHIQYWTQWLQHLLKLHLEPTCAMTMQAVIEWLKETKPKHPQTILVIITGGNIAQDKMAQIWEENMLEQVPHIPK